jgi:V8-like Glu-specific endopeptidase
VLTAAHCLEKAKRPGSTTLKVLKVVTGNSANTNNSDNTYEIKDAAIHHRFWADYRGAFDYGWIKLATRVPNIVPAQLPHNRLQSEELIERNKFIQIAGFGLTSLVPPGSGEEPKIGVKHDGKSPIQFRTGVELFAGNQRIDSCSGDSGGPAYIEDNGRLVLIGVTSRGPMPCASDYEAGAYSLVSEALCWLRSTAGYGQKDAVLSDFCVREAAQGATAEDDKIIMEEDFSKACQNATLPEASRYDLMQLFDVAGIPAEMSKLRCSELQDFIRNVKVLDISSRHMRQLSWLRHAKSLETLFASDNMISTIRAVEELKGLRLLDVRNNAITNIQGLERLAKKITVFGAKTQMKNLDETRYREIAELGAAAGSDKRTLIIVLRDILAVGDIARKSRDLALKRQLNLDHRSLRSLDALGELENLEELSIAGNPEIKDWEPLLTIPRLKWLRYGATDPIPEDVIAKLVNRGTVAIPIPE